jgi:hypothetical protein
MLLAYSRELSEEKKKLGKWEELYAHTSILN